MSEVAISIKGQIHDEMTLEEVVTSIKLFLDANEIGCFVPNTAYKIEIKPVAIKESFYMKKDLEND